MDSCADRDVRSGGSKDLAGDSDLELIATELGLAAGAVPDPEFCFPDANVQLRVGDTLFAVYRQKLAEFRSVTPMLKSRSTLVLEGCPADFKNTFRLLWPNSEFDVGIWMSALRLATRYDYPELREFSIKNLDLKELPIMEYLPMAQECEVLEWKNRAIEHLVTRDEPVSLEEAKLIGVELFVITATRREERIAREPIQAHRRTSLELCSLGPPPGMDLGTYLKYRMGRQRALG
ncbi:hypothetical protein RhiJN_23157 [Ceratobasidium sp. AG-Ba]|nr:hypothetical protein RhiJN_23157 [Ceratobasidium sp. AG-Ba]